MECGAIISTSACAASYTYDTWGNLLGSSESSASAWTNPCRCDGARYDAADGLY